MSDAFRPWIEAWHDSLYGPDGFYRRAEGPAGHFATSAQGIPGVADILAQTVAALAERCEAQVVVDFACGRGELVESLLPFVGENVAIVGVDVVERPPGLDERVTWVRSPGGARIAALDAIAGRRALVIAHEWLDVVPCVVAEADDDGVLRTVEVGRQGDEELGETLEPRDAQWVAEHASPSGPGPTVGQPSPSADVAPVSDARSTSRPPRTWEPGERIEIGHTRDGAWAALVDEVRRTAAPGSVAVGVDYAYRSDERLPLGTLTGFRDGSECAPIPDGSCDVTAHVHLDSLDVDDIVTQRDLLLDLFGSGPLEPVPHSLASERPSEYLQRLALRSAFAAAAHPGGLGGFHWFTKRL